MSPTLSIDTDRCVACGRCEIACVVEHSPSRDLLTAIGQSDAPPPRVTLTQREETPVILVCVHCDDPACAAVCPAGAITKRPAGEVVLIEEECVGCGACAVACHLGVPAARADGRAYVTCDLCPSRRDEGRPTACAEACPTGAIAFDNGKTEKGLVQYIKPGKGRAVYMELVGELVGGKPAR
jgi:anaerobic carbon-monoxide dehydrogenase iron sulfur subunit